MCKGLQNSCALQCSKKSKVIDAYSKTASVQHTEVRAGRNQYTRPDRGVSEQQIISGMQVELTSALALCLALLRRLRSLAASLLDTTEKCCAMHVLEMTPSHAFLFCSSDKSQLCVALLRLSCWRCTP
jgi:hypothetical protein